MARLRARSAFGSPASSRGMSLLEILVVLAVMSVVASIAFLDLRGLGNDLENAADGLEGALRQTRARAMASTSAYRLVMDSSTHLRAEWNTTCGAASGWTADARLDLELGPGIRFAGGYRAGDVLTCFDSRGLSTTSADVSVSDEDGESRTVRLYRGGAVERLSGS